MSKHARRRTPVLSPRKRQFGAVLATLALVATGATLMPANGVTTVPSSETGPHGPVIRVPSATINVDKTAMDYTRTTSATSNYAAQANTSVATSGCRGDNPAGTDQSPRTIVTVKDPNGATVATATSPVRDLSLAGFFTSPQNKPLATQPGPSNTNYRGDFPNANAYHGMSLTVDLTGKPAGTYTVTTENRNMVKVTGTGPLALGCTLGTPNAAATSTGFGTTYTAGASTTTTTFEYRPWHDTFTDVFGKGKVNSNLVPPEYQFTVDGHASAIFEGTASSQKFYTLPSGTSFSLPGDPQSCVDDPSSCLPSTAVQCDPSTGCTPRIMMINRPLQNAQTPSLVGVFDLDTKAFIAHASNGGTVRTLMSLGTTNDALYGSVLAKLEAAAAARGIDLASLLATKVGVTSNGQTLSLSLLDAMQIAPSGKPGGVQIYTDTTVLAGIILNVYANLDTHTCVTKTASNAGYNTSPKTDRFTRSLNNGYTVTRSDYLPAVPATGPLAAVAGGPVYHVLGTFAAAPITNTTSTVLGLDSAADAPGGYPVWLEPFVAAGKVTAAKTFDFMGTATWSASETSLGSAGCLVVDFMVGTGVAVLNNPFPAYGLGTIFDPAAKPSVTGEKLTDAVNAAVAQAVGQATADPTVSALLTQLTALLPL